MRTVIYGDVLIFINIFIDYLLLHCVKKFLNIQIRIRRLLLGSVFASMFSFLIFLPPLHTIISFLIKLITGAIIVFVTFGRCRFRIYFKRVVVFIFFSVCFEGIIYLLDSLFKFKFLDVGNGVVYLAISPVLLIILTLACYFILRLVQRITGKQEVKNYVCDVKVVKNKQEACFKGKVDTACSLREPFSQAPVIIAEKSLFDENLFEDETKMRIIPFESLGGKGLLKGFKMDEIYINNKKISAEIYLGLCESILTGEVKSIINSDILESVC